MVEIQHNDNANPYSRDHSGTYAKTEADQQDMHL